MLWSKELFLMPSQNRSTCSFTITKKQQMQGAWALYGCLPASRLLTTVVSRIIVHPPKGYFRCFCFLTVG